jgi:molybdopterin converting factor small subunit
VKIEVRLFANLREKLPDTLRGRATLELVDGAKLQDLLDSLEIEPRMAQMVLVNGVQAPRDPAAREALRLSAGDSVAIFPPVAGG